MTYDPVKPIEWAKSSIYDIAEKVRKKVWKNQSIELEAVVRQMRGSIVFQNLFEASSTDEGSILIEEDGTFRIYVPDYVSKERNRFTMAHELGHYVLHFLMQDRIGERVSAARSSTSDQDRAEWEANWFAAGFLMPPTEFGNKFIELDRDVVATARHFGVSAQAAKIQASYCGHEV